LVFKFFIKVTIFSPSEKNFTLLGKECNIWDIMEGRIIFQKYANDRYAYIKWTSVQEFLVDKSKP
jgi:hypothetical protein